MVSAGICCISHQTIGSQWKPASRLHCFAICRRQTLQERMLCLPCSAEAHVSNLLQTGFCSSRQQTLKVDLEDICCSSEQLRQRLSSETFSRSKGGPVALKSRMMTWPEWQILLRCVQTSKQEDAGQVGWTLAASCLDGSNKHQQSLWTRTWWSMWGMVWHPQPCN